MRPARPSSRTSISISATRARISAQFEGIYNKTKTEVDDRLAKLDTEVNTTFDDGASSAKTSFYLFLAKELLSYVAGGFIVDLFSEDSIIAPENWGPGEIVEDHIVSPMFLLRNAIRLGRIWATWSMRG